MAEEQNTMVGTSDKEAGTVPARRRRNRKKAMSPVVEAQSIFREAWPAYRYGKRDSIFYQAVRFISPRVQKEFTIRRARSIYEGTAKRIDSEEMDALRAALVEEAHREQRELAARLAALDKKIADFDARMARKAVAGSGQ